MKTALMQLLTVCLILGVAIPASAAHTIESTVATNEITVDGRTDDWEGSPVAYLEESLRVVGVSHDADNLYIMYRFGGARLTAAENELVEGTMQQMREQRAGGMGGGSRPAGGMGGRGGGMGGMGGMGGRVGGPAGGPEGRRPTLDPEIDWLVVTLTPIGS